jgi:hypothetical protein
MSWHTPCFIYWYELRSVGSRLVHHPNSGFCNHERGEKDLMTQDQKAMTEALAILDALLNGDDDIMRIWHEIDRASMILRLQLPRKDVQNCVDRHRKL